MTDLRDQAPPAPPPRSSGSRLSTSALVLGLLPLGLGILAGAQISYQASVGGFSGGLGAAFAVIGIAAVTGILLLVGIVAYAIRPARDASGPAFAAAGLLVAGVIGGSVLAPVIGYRHHDPVVRSGTGAATLALAPTPSGFKPAGRTPISCISVPDGTAVAQLRAMDLGSLGGGTLRAMMSRDPGSGTVMVELYVTDLVLPDGELSPTWSAEVPRVEPIESASGHVAFTASASEPTTDKFGSPLPSPSSAMPTTLAGSIDWSCDGWQPSQGPDQPQHVGMVDLTLTSPATEVARGAPVRCSAGADGTLSGLDGGTIGLLQGQPLAIDVAFSGPPREGGKANLTLRLDRKDPLPSMTFLPSWVGTATITSLESGGLGGTLAFADLPTGVDPSVGQAPAGWPVTVSGTIAWACKSG